MLPDGVNLTTGTDKLLPQFIVRVLPAGISGLVIAGLLSAAMDSLSSGLNAACSVITVDWIDRFRRDRVHGQAHVREARLVSWSVGLVVIVLSLFASVVPGNLLERCYTVVNLLVTPLFILFFMAMFVPWATAPGTWIGSLATLAMAVGIGHGGFLGLSFIWMMPVSLLTGIIVGCLASALPIGERRPMLELGESSATATSDAAL
jgi:SSS family solute:Na+ symporter